MKFFTPRLLRRMHRGHRDSAVEWQAATALYQSYLATLADTLPPSATVFGRLHFHDCRLERIEFVAPDSAMLGLRGFKNYLSGTRGVSGLHQLVFKGVVESDLSLRHVGAYWVCQEIDRAGDAGELRVALAEGRRSQFRICFRSVSVRTTESA